MGVVHEEWRLIHIKPKYTDQKGKKREFCDSGWSKDGIEFYNEVRKRWRDIAFANNCDIWSDLEGAWAEYAEENNFGNIYSQKNTRHDISSDTPDYEEAQEEELPADRFSVRDEMNNCLSKENKTHKEDEDGSDYDNECSGPWKRAKEWTTIFLGWVQAVTRLLWVNMRVWKNMAESVTGRGIGGAASKNTHTWHMQLWTHL